MVFMNTQVATAAALIGWIAVEQIRDKHMTSLGAASGAVAGLVAITPSCASVSPLGAIAIGLIAGAVCAVAIGLKNKFGFDDALDVVGVHLVGGIVGTLLIGFFATKQMVASFTNGAKAGLFYGGGIDQLLAQAEGAGIVLGYSFVVSLLLALAVHKTIGLRVDADAEDMGVDTSEHAESAYDFAGLASLSRSFGHLSSALAGNLEVSGAEGAEHSDPTEAKVEA
jgi:ammonium transporter, Amt family